MTELTGGRCPVHLFQGIPCPLCGPARVVSSGASLDIDPIKKFWDEESVDDYPTRAEDNIAI